MALVARGWQFRCGAALRLGNVSAPGDAKEIVELDVLIAEKLGMRQPTASEHMKILLRAGLVRAKRIKRWTFYKRDETSIKKVKRILVEQV